MIKIRSLDKSYIDKILALEAESAPPFPIYYGWTKEALERDIFSENSGKAFGAFDGDKLVGWSSYQKEPNGVYQMSGIVVDKNYRRKGIGLRLFKIRIKELLEKPDLTKIYATNYPKNSPIIIMELNHGFVIYDYKKDVYGPGADRVYVKYEL